MGDLLKNILRRVRPLVMFSITSNIIFTGCSASMSKFDWLASESAPKGYPMEVVDGHFYDKKGGRFYIPPGRTIQDGWGGGVSTHVVGADKKYLPNRFDITCFSYTEDVFYEGGFDLPYDEISDFFRKGYYSPRLDEAVTFDAIVAGVAPGGYVTVWVEGVDKRTEVFRSYLKKADISWTRIVDNSEMTREEFIDVELKDVLNEVQYKEIKNKIIPFGLWEKYARRYNWKPIISNVEYDGMVKYISFVNGEQDYYSVKHNNDWSDRDYPVPTELTFTWRDAVGRSVMAEIKFDKETIIQAFENMSQKTLSPFVLDVHVEHSEKGTYYSAGLVAGNVTEPINEIKIRLY